MEGSSEEPDLYEILGVHRGASKSEIKKAYHKAALASHPDKVAQGEREEAETKFKAVSQAYEILFDDEKRERYDTYGMSAFDSAHGGGSETEFEDILSHLFGQGAFPPGFEGQRAKRPAKGKDVEQKYSATLEELYKGKSVKFASTKNVVCSICTGTGGKDKAKPKTCSKCKGEGFTQHLRPVRPGVVTQETLECSNCNGSGNIWKEKDRCRKCKGKRVIEEKKVLEIYIPPGSKQGDRIILDGEADEVPEQKPGDIVFIIEETHHEIFSRAGPDLTASLKITLVESLCGFSRVVLTHLDGRGIQLTHPRGRVLRPDQCLKIAGEGMPRGKSDIKGDLYLVVEVQFPEDGWTTNSSDFEQLANILPSPSTPIRADTVDEVEYEESSIEDFGGTSGDPRGGSAWLDEEDDEESGNGPQCAQQ
ncbi:MAG: hypothetical protein M1829_005932 [Trizodia sp. TS-e1964]|nr:MAG: hypothetical protein M1829_005932 [Trizodia sp. TS-e1964]